MFIVWLKQYATWNECKATGNIASCIIIRNIGIDASTIVNFAFSGLFFFLSNFLSFDACNHFLSVWWCVCSFQPSAIMNSEFKFYFTHRTHIELSAYFTTYGWVAWEHPTLEHIQKIHSHSRLSGRTMPKHNCNYYYCHYISLEHLNLWNIMQICLSLTHMHTHTSAFMRQATFASYALINFDNHISVLPKQHTDSIQNQNDDASIRRKCFNSCNEFSVRKTQSISEALIIHSSFCKSYSLH